MNSFDFHLFDTQFNRENMMGPNCLRILDELLLNEHFSRGMRVLDLGCGRGLTSMYMAKRYGATVFATDLWIPASENYARFITEGLDDLIIPIHAEAHHLPFASEYFDAVISVDAYHYFGIEPDYLTNHLAPLLKPDGRILIGIPGLKEEFNGHIPSELKPFWQSDMNFHTTEWWKNLWSAEKKVYIEQCFELQCMQAAWADWLVCDNEYARGDIAMMEAEGGRYFNLVGIRARKQVSTE